MLQEFGSILLQKPTSVTAAGVTGSYVDLKGYANPGGRALKFVLIVGPGTTAGEAGGYIQHADDTGGTGLATLATFSTLTSAGGSSEIHAVTNKRYVRFVGTVETDKDMILAATAFALKRTA